MYVAPPRLNTHTICPADLQVAYSTTIVLADIEKPVENVVVVFGIEDDFVGAIENGGRFLVDEFADAEERGVCRSFARVLAFVDEPFLS